MTLNQLKDRAAELFNDPANVTVYGPNPDRDTVVVSDGDERYEVSSYAALRSNDGEMTGIRLSIPDESNEPTQRAGTRRRMRE